LDRIEHAVALDRHARHLRDVEDDERGGEPLADAHQAIGDEEAAEVPRQSRARGLCGTWGNRRRSAEKARLNEEHDDADERGDHEADPKSGHNAERRDE
jgi:hypothetical protein